ncbi:sensor domain-containing phosphodiesterase [Mangrovicella endophytica]|uniref:sensor domain-containing phosphodiesterase n=1 Tax=Mangrovicella endophytica TaxID=2066697 RepID=UPI0018E4B2D7|nr:EAL domain-containing protein [Mangrovicella endophytica]
MSSVPAFPIPENEIARLEALESFSSDLLPAEPFDLIVRLAASIFGAPKALVTLIGAHHQLFKARIGIDDCQTSRDVSFCTHAIMSDEVFVVLDAKTDGRFASHPAVIGTPFVRFYAGAPLVDPDGYRLGSVCVFDAVPRAAFSGAESAILKDLAALTMERMVAHRAGMAHSISQARLQNIMVSSPDAIITADAENTIRSWNEASQRMFGYSAAEAIGQPLDIIVPPALRSTHRRGLVRAAGDGSHRIVATPLSLTACRRDGQEFPIEISLSQWQEAGEPRFGAIIRDITQRKEAEDRLRHAADFDYLTELANRATLLRQMEEICGTARSISILLLDLDGFKEVNDNLGHSVGDHVLKVVSIRLKRHVETSNLVARLGGDEFVVLLPDTEDPLAAEQLAQQLIGLIEEPIEYGEEVIHIGASVGIVARSTIGCDADALLGDADLALYQAKADGRHLVRLFTPELRHVAATRSSTGSGLRRAWEEGEFELYYQPQVRLSDGGLTGAEALLRWNRPGLGIVSPVAFLPVLETGLLAVPVGAWILEEACRQAAAWRRNHGGELRMGVNLFAAQFKTGDLAATVESVLARSGLPPEALELEITENIILRNEQTILSPLEQLRSFGVGIAFDDFGTGYASLSMLKNYPVTRLKIDRSFVADLEFSRRDRTIIESVINMGSAFGVELIAEGVETQGQADALRGEGCQEGQGYLFGRPMPAAAFECQFLSRSRNVDGAAVYAAS